jgi:hypothetical protein
MKLHQAATLKEIVRSKIDSSKKEQGMTKEDKGFCTVSRFTSFEAIVLLHLQLV